MRAILVRVCAAVATVLVIIFGAATAVSAEPSGCNSYTTFSIFYGEGGEAYCAGGTGHFRVSVYCTSNPSSGIPYVWAKGSWRLTGQGASSWVWCPSSRPYAIAASYEYGTS